MGNLKNKIVQMADMYLKTKAEYDEAIKTTCIIDFTATWCPPCKMIGPKFEALAASGDYPNITFKKIDVDDNKEASEAAGIACMPTFKVYKDGKEVEKLEGANESKLKELCAKYN